MSGKLHITLLIVLIPLLSWSNDGLNRGSKTNLLSRSYLYEGGGSFAKFNHRPYLSFGYRNFMLDYQATIQFKNWVEIGAGVGFHRSAVKFYSASDERKVRLFSLPTYATVTIYPYHDDNKAFYIKGNYGFANNLSGSKNKNDKSLQGNVMQVEIGYKQFSSSIDRHWFVELSQYSSMAKGTFSDSETYNAEIDYNLQFYGIVLSVGINLNRF